MILDVNGYEVGATVGPYNEGDTLQLSCTVKGGNLDIPHIDFKTFANLDQLSFFKNLEIG